MGDVRLLLHQTQGFAQTLDLGQSHGGELIVLEFRQLSGAEHRLIAHQNRRIDFLIAVLFDVQIEHELGQRPLKPRQSALEHDKTRARHARRRFEIHQPQGFADLEMLPGLETCGKRGLFADATQLDIVILVGAKRNAVQRRVGDGGEFALQRGDRFALLRLDFAHVDFEFAHFRLERIDLRLIAGFHRLTDFLRSGIASFLRRLRLGDAGPPRVVEAAQPGEQTLRAGAIVLAANLRVEEGFGVFANPLYVIH